MTKKITNKFYLGSPKMNEFHSAYSQFSAKEWSAKTLEEAIAKARKRVEDTGEAQIIVQIVRVVRPQKAPTIVEKV